jgi:hypothetical protein
LSTFLFGKEKKRDYREEMEMFPIILGILVGLTLLGAIIETFIPGFVSKKLQKDLSVLTLGVLGIAISILFLMVFLKARIREGFEEQSYMTRWNSLMNESRASDVCKLYLDAFEKVMKVEKGAPPEPVKTDAQAREATEKVFTNLMTTSPVSCSLLEEVDSRKQKLDTFYLAVQKLPDTFLIQVYETAVACRSLLINQYLEVQRAEKERQEGFQDFELCSDAAAQERRAFKERKPLSEDAQKCMLVEEIPPEKKIDSIVQKLNRLDSSFKSYMLTAKVKEPIGKILQDAEYYKNELEKKTKEAQETSNKYQFK